MNLPASLLVTGILLVSPALPQQGASPSCAQDSLGKSHLPISGRITSPYGMRIHPIFKLPEFHKGLDVGAALGTPIRVQTAGIIEQAAVRGTFGLYIRIRHSAVFETVYAHLSAFAPGIHPGVMVFAGDEIGKVGSSGLSTGSHLHLEWIYRGIPIDPTCAAPIRPSPPQPVEKRISRASSRKKSSSRTASKSSQRRLYEKSK